jgi:hypothetical protein
LSEYVHINGSFDASWAPVGGISLDLLAPRLNEGLSFHVEVFYMTSSYRLTETENYFGLITWDDITIKLQDLHIPIGVRYAMSGKNVVPYFNVGFSPIFNLKTSANWKDEKNPTGHQEDPIPFKSNQFGLWGGVGIYKSVSKKLSASLEVRYEITNSIAKTSSQPPEIDSKIHNFYFTIGIRTK